MANYKEMVETLPADSRQNIFDYIERGVSPGSFFVSVLSNNLREAFATADMIHKPYIENYLVYFEKYAPAKCWGSAKIVADWIKRGGLEGKK